MRIVLKVDEHGNVLEKFRSVKDASEKLGINSSSVVQRIQKKKVYNGVLLRYGDEAERLRDGKFVQEGRKGRDEMTEDELEMARMKAEKRGMVLERVEYELRCGVIPIKPCLRPDCGSDFSRAMIGGMACMSCRYFRGKCKETRTVLCAYKSIVRTQGERVKME
jgi:hypothetical protein